ncbi:Ribosome biogenesis protein [Entomophthora muscae]|uniref:Ribosome biogenesis protein n=1 Tax=Entomophthora muscae TaxID=34485 RepID=A0ACC2RRK0_9FUNG|nr:Ribosome biogenesis protein [Entomophthora muscae]
MVTKATFVGDGFTRKPPKYERFIRPMALRYKKAHVTHPELGATFQLPIIGVKKNPQSPLYTQLGVLTKGTVIEVNVSELGLVTSGGKVVWGKYAQITNNPENDGCINSVVSIFPSILLTFHLAACLIVVYANKLHPASEYFICFRCAFNVIFPRIDRANIISTAVPYREPSF